ncbi:MAG TPA: tRNA 2-thiocytidine biosynthesis TtcA family protein [Rhabdochlamydiaceae bacterium]|nr:tRNA 2-thiocytidine biosynthesis TtcA family protein [Rhabdochlamydiaceae bacterium]
MMTKSPLPIARPPWTKLGRKLESMCRKALYEFELLEGVDKLAIALSGGKDSLTLLFLLKAILGNGVPDLPLVAIHVGGEFSCGASLGEGYLKGICKELGVEFISCISDRKRENLECYSCSRERRKLIFNAAKEAGATTVAFGHHREDSIQTLLMNLLHKAEFAANLPKVPMVDYGVTIIRPLIYIPQNAIKEFANHYGFVRITCQCPVGQTSMRRKVDDILMQLEETFPNVRENLAQASRNFGSKKALLKRVEHDN